MAKDQIIMGIDPGTNILGYGVISIGCKGPEYVDMGVLDLRKEKEHFCKLGRIFSETGALMDRFSPDFLSIESPFYGKNPQVILKLGRVQGAVISAAMLRDIPVQEYAPRKAKLSITGVGAASKEQVCTMIQRILGVRLNPDHLDATDALAIALCHYYQSRSPLAGVRSSSGWEQFIASNPDRIKK